MHLHVPFRALSLAALALLLAISAAHGQGLRERLRERMTQQRSQGTTLPPPSGMQVQRDVAYGSHPRQRFDVYLPAQPHGAPIIVMVHGGAWRMGDKANPGVADNKSAFWVPKGFILVSVNNRLLPDAKPLEQARDVAAAVARVEALAPSWGGDPRALVLMGHSAGAHLAALLEADPALLKAAGATPPRAVVSLDSAAMDVPALMRGGAPLPRLYEQAFGSDQAYWIATSPYHQLQAGAPPMLIVCSSRRADSCPQGRALAAKAQGLGVRMEVLPVDLVHGEINQQLGLPSAYTTAVARFIDGALGR